LVPNAREDGDCLGVEIDFFGDRLLLDRLLLDRLLLDRLLAPPNKFEINCSIIFIIL
jgi:hypothetical protein